MPARNKQKMDDNLEEISKKKSRHSQKFIGSYSTKYPTLKPSPKGPTFAHCSACMCNFSVAHGGINDCKTHVEGPRHKENLELTKRQPSNSRMFGNESEGKDMRHKTTTAEMHFVAFLLEHNIPVSAADHAAQLFRNMFPDSKIAQNFQCGTTEACALMKDQTEIISNKFAYNSSTEGSSSDTLFPVVLPHPEDGLIRQSLLSGPVVEGSLATEKVSPEAPSSESVPDSQSCFVNASRQSKILSVVKTEPDSISGDVSVLNGNNVPGLQTEKLEKSTSLPSSSFARVLEQDKDVRCLYYAYLQKEIENRDQEMVYRALKMRKLEKELLLLDKQLPDVTQTFSVSRT